MRSNTDLIVSPQAEDDIGDIYEYRRKTWGAARADAYVQVIDAAFRGIQAFPTSAR